LITQEDDEKVKERLWGKKGSLDNLIERISDSSCDIVHLQHENGLFDDTETAKLIDGLSCANKIVIVTFHAMPSKNFKFESLNNCSLIISHTEHIKDNLFLKGVKPEIVKVIPHGQMKSEIYDKLLLREKLDILKNSIVVGTHGFLCEHKGVDKIIEALPELKSRHENILFLAVCSTGNGSLDYYNKCKEKARQLGVESNVRFITDYLTQETIQEYLQACDVLVASYVCLDVGFASGALRAFLAAQRPLITTKVPVLSEYAECSLQIEKPEAALIADGIEKMLDNNFSEIYLQKINEKLAENSWESISKIHFEEYKSANLRLTKWWTEAKLSPDWEKIKREFLPKLNAQGKMRVWKILSSIPQEGTKEWWTAARKSSNWEQIKQAKLNKLSAKEKIQVWSYLTQV